ncbi:MAG: general stress protein [Alkalibacterium sp.]|nr:general stress protein [Alkalibacterium sp.]
MKNNKRTVIGSYSSRDDALDVVDRLNSEGYQKQDIILYSNDPSTLDDHEAVKVSTDDQSNSKSDRNGQDNDRSMWDKVKDAFTPGTYNDSDDQTDQYNDVLNSYKSDLNEGKIVVVVENYRGKNLEEHNSSGALLNSNRETDDMGDPLTEGRAFERAEDNKDNFKN